MYTQCPGCNALHELHARDLSLAQGQVRCGACQANFNALLYLSEDSQTQTPTTAGLLPPGPEPTEDGYDSGGASPDEPADDAFEPSAAEAEPAAATDDEPAREELSIPEDAESSIAAHAAELLPEKTALAPEDGEAPAAVAPEVAAADTDEVFLRARTGQSQQRWSIAAVLLLLLLGMQLVHQSRDALVQLPALAPLVYRLYRALGLELDPQWDVTRYAIVRRPEMSAVPEAHGERATLRLVATVANGAQRAQPLPLLRLTLENRWGETVAARDFQPREYLHDAPRDERLLAPSEEARAELLFVDPGVDSVGFTLDLCLPDAAGAVHCANDES